jgi:hypothetical protein
VTSRVDWYSSLVFLMTEIPSNVKVKELSDEAEADADARKSLFAVSMVCLPIGSIVNANR